ncbi:porin [Janthinobacterium sp. PC23-8]|uniref:porin n=1 Tax=Janthinobacterium sp. PC23-8 TaxID=2012679 RepID=UPI000B9707E6|nr:porin [Janthinobacterium sp. PC23-8]OYO29770.1 hypothetical protein CD932_00435 [Janthinobacterium sp. PC23-8]
MPAALPKLVDTGIQSPNLLRFRGSEDLGIGNKAIFMLESRFQLDTGAQVGNFFGRQAYAGLSGDWGTLTAGNQYEFMFESLSQQRFGPVIKYVSLYVAGRRAPRFLIQLSNRSKNTV